MDPVRINPGRIACALLASTASVALATPAAAQTSTTSFPVRQFEDGNGVDLLSGAFTTSSPAVAIGDAETGLSFQREVRAGASIDNMLGTITVSGSAYTVTIEGKSEKFTLSNGVFTPVEQNGSTLAYGGSGYIYRGDDGTVGNFTAGMSGFGNAASNIVLSSLVYPHGKTLTFHFTTASFQQLAAQTPNGPVYTTISGRRLQSVTSNTGYQIKFEYESDTVTSTGNIGPWVNVTKVTGLNDLIDSCAPAAYSCTPSSPRPTLAISPLSAGTNKDYTDSLGRVTHYDFDGNGITGIRTPGNASNNISVAYSNGKVASVTADGIATSYAYADAGNIRTTTVTNALGKSSVFTFDLAKLLMLTSRDPLNRTTTYTYDSNNRPVAIIQPEGNNVTYAYDSRGNVITTTANAKPGSGLSVVQTSASFDATCSNPVTCNKPNSTSDAYGRATDYTYDSTHGGVLSVTAPAPTSGAVRPQVRYTYARFNANGAADANGVVRATETSACQTQTSCAGAADEVKSTVTYGANQNVASISSGAGNGSLTATSSFTYDAVGNRLTADGPLAGSADTTRYRYDAGSRIEGVVSPDPDGAGPLKLRAQRISYNAFGSAAQTEAGTVTDQSDAAWTNFAPAYMTYGNYDGYGRLIRDHSWSNNVHYSVRDHVYDALGRDYCTVTKMDPATWGPQASTCAPAQTTGPNGPDRVARTIFDDAGQPIEVQLHNGTAFETERKMSYTLNGKPQYLYDGENNVTGYIYDGFDRMIATQFPSPTKGSGNLNIYDHEYLWYDNNGNVTQRRTRAGQLIGYGYDALNRMISKGSSHLADQNYSYDLLGRMLTAKFTGSGLGITNTYDALGRQSSSTTNVDGVNRTFNAHYDIAGNRTGLSGYGGYSADYTYDMLGRMTNFIEFGTTPAARFGYDDLGRRTSVGFGAGAVTSTVSYAYDPVSRLSSIGHDLGGSGADLTIGSMSYNPASQIVSQTRSNDAYAWTGHYNVNRSYTSNGLNQYTAAGPASFTYDANGNMTGDGTSSFTYDAENRLISVTKPGGVLVYLDYDPLGRLWRISGDTTVQRRFAYDGDRLIAEYDAAGNITRHHFHGPGADEPVMTHETAGGWHREYYHADERGSVVALSDNAGNSVSTNRYDEYGTPASTNTGTFQYTGQMWLPEIGLYYYKARFYSPTSGRFLQPDPIGYGDGMNMYAYVGNDPVNMVDPSGTTGKPSPEKLAEMIAASKAAGMAASCYPMGCTAPGGGLMVSMSNSLFESQVAASNLVMSKTAGFYVCENCNQPSRTQADGSELVIAPKWTFIPSQIAITLHVPVQLAQNGPMNRPEMPAGANVPETGDNHGVTKWFWDNLKAGAKSEIRRGKQFARDCMNGDVSGSQVAVDTAQGAAVGGARGAVTGGAAGAARGAATGAASGAARSVVTQACP